MGNGALAEAMGLLDQAIGDNSQVEQPYRTKCIIKIVNGCVDAVYLQGMIADVEVYTAEGIERITSESWGCL